MLFQLFRFLLRRLAVSLPLVVAVVFVTFMLVRIGGGDPVALLAGPTASKEEHAAIRAGLGLDRSLIEQFGIYVAKAAQGDLGQSWLSSKQVIDEIFNRAVVTLELLLWGVVIGAMVGIPLGARAAARRGSLFDQVVRAVSLAGFSIPTYWLGLIAILTFFYALDLAPAPMGRVSAMLSTPDRITGSYLVDALLRGQWEVAQSAFTHLVLPVLTIAVVACAPIMKHTRAIASEIVDSEFIRFARSSGLGERRIRRMVLRNSMVPVLTFVGDRDRRAAGHLVADRTDLLLGRHRPMGAAVDPERRLRRHPGLRAVRRPSVGGGVHRDRCRQLPARAARPGAHVMAGGIRSWLNVFRGFPSIAIGSAIVLVFAVLAVLAPWIAPMNPIAVHSDAVLSPPSARFLLGTDGNGMDLLSRIIYGSRYAFGIAVPAVLLSVLIGLPVGLWAGYRGGWVDEVLLRSMDLLRVFPSIILALTIVAATGQSITNVILVIGLLDAPIFARVVRAEILALRGGLLIESARAIGNGTGRMLFVHVLPNSMSGALTQISVRMAWAIRVSATLAFVGIGIQQPTPEWGAMIRQGAEYMVTGEWWVALFPGLALVTLIFGLNLAADGIQDWMGRRRTQR
jgi:ABC-type dipeptide/oligopeptide/nickel transport system permease subunit